MGQQKEQIIECVPNFSVGRDEAVIRAIATAIGTVNGIKLLNIDRGADANRTVFTFVGSVGAVCEAAFRSVGVASKMIDMRTHHGTHPRIGATDVMPLVPVSGITLAELVPHARALARRVGEELGVPVYCYQAAALSPERINLESCRQGEYEGLAAKIVDPQWIPDFGPTTFTPAVAQTGLSVIGAREYLVAVNFNLDTQDLTIAKNIARDIRAARRAGQIESIKAIGWYVEEYGFVQVSTNLTSVDRMPLHVAWRVVNHYAAQYGAQVTGTEIIGLVPRRVLMDAGHYLADDDDLNEEQTIQLAIEKLGLSTIREFDPQKRIIERVSENYIFQNNF
ncbi:MAG: glutamate formimidoyltransferase [Mucinivorans sp.]